MFVLPVKPLIHEAARWYREAKLSHPRAFPTDSLSLAAGDAPHRQARFKDLSPEAPRIVTCSSCSAKNRLASGLRQARCGRCRQPLA
ncbi:MAG: hypothetical protein NDJ94_23475 [Vicinamibacteria bacterium]|nr:hypothetical protein [Vicinamibacteria bacterium]